MQAGVTGFVGNNFTFPISQQWSVSPLVLNLLNNHSLIEPATGALCLAQGLASCLCM
jgi:hypothetical protein